MGVLLKIQIPGPSMERERSSELQRGWHLMINVISLRCPPTGVLLSEHRAQTVPGWEDRRRQLVAELLVMQARKWWALRPGLWTSLRKSGPAGSISEEGMWALKNHTWLSSWYRGKAVRGRKRISPRPEARQEILKNQEVTSMQNIYRESHPVS